MAFDSFRYSQYKTHGSYYKAENFLSPLLYDLNDVMQLSREKYLVKFCRQDCFAACKTHRNVSSNLIHFFCSHINRNLQLSHIVERLHMYLTFMGFREIEIKLGKLKMPVFHI